jgi:hypothetical protein
MPTFKNKIQYGKVKVENNMLDVVRSSKWLLDVATWKELTDGWWVF